MKAARAKPGELTLAAAGPGTPAQIAFEMLKRAANVNMTFVPYPGGPPAITALLGEHVTSAISDYPGAAEQLKAGKLRALATASPMHFEALPDVPTAAEAGYEDIEDDLWFGLAAPAKTRRKRCSNSLTVLRRRCTHPKARTGFQPGSTAVGCGCRGAENVLRQRYDQFGRVIRESNFKAE
jgi:tripartite-type tricarboxylate transporter receptor subunit TctC